jgi:TonB-dependent receptor
VKSLQHAFLCGVSVAAFMLPAMAQESVETITVTGYRTSLRDSLEMKQKSALITENISTKDIGQLPDITIGEELNRLPGVNTQRDRGNASQVAIRGLGPRFVFGLVNGREVASSEPTQNVRYESYPSEILTGAQVYKTQDASLIGGGIAATIDIRTSSPLEYNGPVLQVRLGPSYNTEADNLPHYDPLGFRGSIGLNYHVTDNFAFSLAGSMQRQKNGYPTLKFWTENTNQPDTGWGNPANLTGKDPTKLITLPDGSTALTGGNPAPWGGSTEVKNLQQDRYGLAGTAEWKVNDSLVIKADGLISSYVISENQYEQYYDANGTAWPGGNWYACDASSVTAGIITTDMLAACKTSYTRYGNDGIPGVAAGSGASYWYTTPGSSFKVDGMGHVVSATLNTGGTDGSGAWNTVPLANNINRYYQRQTLIVSGLNFAYNQGPWQAKLDLSHSEAWRNNQWLGFQTNLQYAATTGFNMERGTAPYVTSSLNPAIPANNTTAYTVGAPPIASGGAGWCTKCIDAGPEQTRDHVSAIAGDVSHDFEGSFISKISAGMRWSARAKTHHKWDYAIQMPDATLPTSDLESFTIKDFTVPPMLYANWKVVAPIVFKDMANTVPEALGGTKGNPYLGTASWDADQQGARAANGFQNLILDWKVQETSIGGYLKAEFDHTIGGIPVQGGIGVRVEDLKTVSTGWQHNTDDSFTPVRLGNHYTDALPSVYLNAHVTDDQLVRFGASMAVSRPPLDTLNTGYNISTVQQGGQPPSGTSGNPMLKPFRATNVDLDYEWFFHEESMVSVAGYYKHIMNYIGSGITPMAFSGNTYPVSAPVNGKGGDLYGLEMVFQSRFYFLPGFLSDFGVYANASFVDSNIKEFHPITNPYSMAGMAHNSDEVDLWYSKGGFEARIAMKYHSSFTMVPGWDSQQLDTLDPETTIDFITSYQWNDNIGLRFQAMNLTNQATRMSGARQGDAVLRGSNDPNDLAAYSVFGRTFMFEVSYKM